MSYWHRGSIMISKTRGSWVAGSNPFTLMNNILTLNSADSVKTFRENLNVSNAESLSSCKIHSFTHNNINATKSN